MTNIKDPIIKAKNVIQIADDESLQLDRLMHLDRSEPLLLEIANFTGGALETLQAFMTELSGFVDVRAHAKGFIAGTGFVLLCSAHHIAVERDSMFNLLEVRCVAFAGDEKSIQLVDEANDWVCDQFKQRFDVDASTLTERWLTASELQSIINEIAIV